MANIGYCNDRQGCGNNVKRLLRKCVRRLLGTEWERQTVKGKTDNAEADQPKESFQLAAAPLDTDQYPVKPLPKDPGQDSNY